jgi:glycosyltransferase involved in cell wall biosynthesis
MRVLVVASYKPLAGGVEAYYQKIARHVTFEADFVPVGRAKDDIGPLGEVLGLGGKALSFLFRLMRRRYAVVLLNPSLEARSLIRDLVLLLLAKCAGRRCIVFFHGWQPELEEKITQRYRGLIRLVLNRADALIVLAEQFRRTLRAWGVSRPIYVESMAVDWPVDAEAVLKSRRERTGGPLRLLFVARLIKSKGLQEAIETLRILRDRGLDVYLMVAGDGPELEPARCNAQERGIQGIRFLGYLRGPQKQAAFLEADLLFLPTRHGEGMPNAVLEAMAYGLPVVTRAIGGVVDFFEDRQMGAITTSTEPTELADLIERFVETGPRLEAGRINIEFSGRFFRAATVARRLELLVREVAAVGVDRSGRSWLAAEDPEPPVDLQDR